ncbi:MAG TPA: signal peptide peptidase SppA [Candidatus Polarisedimenticolia bacterium]|nr:signal peptide peptidase SppA [Candidatus Polarisedimenticolia bacterium]
MTRGAKGCLLLTGSLLVVLVVVVAAAVMLSGSVQKSTVLELTISGSIEDDADDTIQARLFQAKPTILSDITLAIERAKTDDKITGLMAVIKPFSMGLGKIQEIRDSVIDFRSSGKWAHVFMETAGEFSGGNSTYYLATAFDDITLAPPGDVNLFGLFGVSTFLRGTFDKIGIYPDFDSIGKYKNAKDIYTEKKMTAAHREATTQFMQDWLDQMVAGIAEGRHMEKTAVRDLMNKGPFTGEEARDAGLVDHLGYIDEFEDAVEARNGGDLPKLGFKEYLEKKGKGSGRNRIAVITGMGIILTGKSSTDPMTGALMGSDTVVEAFKKARKDKGIKAIVFRVDSPGGSAVASDLIWRETQLARKEKPVIISMSDLAASGGYYVSAGATKIVAQPGTLTGSIGVVAGKLVTKDLYEWLGLSRDEIQLGDHAAYYYDGKRYSDEEKAIYWKFMHKVYGKFTQCVADGRGMTTEAVDQVGQGHVWSGSRAKDLGLVDELGGLSTAVRLAKTEAGIPDTESVALVFLPEKKSLFESLLWPEEQTATRAVLPEGVGRSLREVARLSLLQQEKVWLMAPPTPVDAP